MVCYTVPTIAALVHYILRRNIPVWKKSVNHLWLSLLLTGGAIFGVVDHWWNGELLLIGEEPLLDIMLGVTITIVIFVVWAIIPILNKSTSHKLTKQTN
jgi:hypothetical protein